MAAGAQNIFSRIPIAAKVTIIAAVVAGVGFVYWIVFYSEVAAKIEGADRQRKSLRDDLASSQAAQATYFADRGELAVREQRSKELSKVLPDETDDDQFLSTVQQASNAAGVTLNSYAPLDEVRQAYYAKVPMRLSVSGNFHQIAKFSFELGKVDRIVNVENLSLTDPRVAGDDVVLNSQCLATAFHALKAAKK